MKEARRWEDLPTDCLVNVLAQVDTETLVESVQVVCKSWYRASLNPHCRQHLVFTEQLCSDDFVQFVLSLSKQSATAVFFHVYSRVSDESLYRIFQSCPLLETLHLPFIFNDTRLNALVSYCKKLECIKVQSSNHIEEVLKSISIHCKNLAELLIFWSVIWEEEALLIVQGMPKLKVLQINDCTLDRLGLVMILKGCSELEYVDVSDCIGFDEMDNEILKLASRLKYFDASDSRFDS